MNRHAKLQRAVWIISVFLLLSATVSVVLNTNPTAVANEESGVCDEECWSGWAHFADWVGGIECTHGPDADASDCHYDSPVDMVKVAADKDFFCCHEREEHKGPSLVDISGTTHYWAERTGGENSVVKFYSSEGVLGTKTPFGTPFDVKDCEDEDACECHNCGESECEAEFWSWHAYCGYSFSEPFDLHCSFQSNSPTGPVHYERDGRFLEGKTTCNVGDNSGPQFIYFCGSDSTPRITYADCIDTQNCDTNHAEPWDSISGTRECCYGFDCSDDDPKS
jgi:hypothetical protein